MTAQNIFFKIVVFLSLLIIFCSDCVAQNVEIQSERLISEGIQEPLNEPHLVINPQNPDHWMIGAILTKSWEEGEQPQSYIVVLQSRDAGITWEEKHFDKNISLGADPWLEINRVGTVVLSSLNRSNDGPSVYLYLYSSADTGKTWKEDPLNLGPNHDRQSIVVDPITQNFVLASVQYNYNRQGSLVMGLRITRLARNGTLLSANFHALSNISKNNGTPVITPENKLIVPYVDFALNGEMLETRRNWLVISDDMGKTFSSPNLMSEGGRYPRILLDTLAEGHSKLHYLRSLGSFRDYTGFVSKTTSDYGYTWTEEVDIDQFEGDNPYIRNPEWAINKDGIIGVFWYDRRDRPGTEYHDLFFAYSSDHGQSFSEPKRITSKPSKPDAEANGMVDRRWPVGGDYFGLDTLPDGSFVPVWVDYRNGRPQLYTATLKVNL